MRGTRVASEIRQPRVSGIGLDSEVASETSADFATVCDAGVSGVRPFPCVMGSMVVVVGLEIRQFIFQICTRPAAGAADASRV